MSLRYILEYISQRQIDNRYRNVYCIENPIYVFSEMKLRGLVSNSYIQKSVSDLYMYIPRIDLPVLLQQARQTNPGNI